MLEVKPYTYNYDNGELYSNATPMTEVTGRERQSLDGPEFHRCRRQGVLRRPRHQALRCAGGQEGHCALPCGIDKYNSYRKYGETAVMTQTSKLGHPAGRVVV
jgi:iron complex outermembrane receptor protein